MLEINNVYKGDCLELMKEIPDKSVDMILCDLPYGITQNKWDCVIPFEPLWKEYKRIVKDDSAIVLTANQPFTSAVVMSNPKMFKHCWVWQKPKGTGHLNAKIMPMKSHEDILVFSKFKNPKYNPQMVAGKPYTILNGSKNALNKGNYGKTRESYDSINNGTRYPKTVLNYNTESQIGKGLHPTQKPVSLFEYLIKTYTNIGDLVLDNCAGSGTTAIAAMNAQRNYILIEKEQEYIDIINKRIAEHE